MHKLLSSFTCRYFKAVYLPVALSQSRLLPEHEKSPRHSSSPKKTRVCSLVGRSGVAVDMVGLK